MQRRLIRLLAGTTGLGLCLAASVSGCGPSGTDGGPSSGGAGLPTGGAGPADGGGTSSGGTSGGTTGSGGLPSAGGSPGSGGSTSTACKEPSDAGPLTTRLPCLLSETGLYQADMTTLAEGVHPYTPSFHLWSDSASKNRWIYLPPGTQIDTADMDYWQYPPGTKLWKEFVRDGVRVETRLIQKQSSGAWQTVAYQWRADLEEADAVPNGVQNASGTQHDIPDTEMCLRCHSQLADKALGFSAIQLSHEPASPDEWTLSTLVADGLLTAPPAGDFAFQAGVSQTDRDFFGYLHANCGHCHNPTGTANSTTGLDMWLKVADVASADVTTFSVYQSVYDVDIAWLDGPHPDADKRVAPGNPENSALLQRFLNKTAEWTMPPVGTEDLDPTGQAVIEAWIAAHP